MSRRSQSPEGVGDLLKQDSFGGYDEDERMHDGQVHEIGFGLADVGEEASSKDDQSTGNGTKQMAIGSEGNGRMQQAKGGKFQSFKAKGPARYFIVKSNNSSNIEHSVKNGIWATQKHNEDKLVDALRTASHVYLIFSVNMSGHFQGYAKMSGFPFKHQQGAWEGSAAVSNSFNVDWIRRYDLPFRETEHLLNPLNENKPVKISRDGQELPLPLGLQLCRMFDEGADAAGVPRPSPAVRNPGMRAGPAVGGRSMGMGGGMGRGKAKMSGPMPPHGPPGGMVMTPMGPMPTALAMQMGGGMMGFGGGMMDELSMVAPPMGMPLGMGMHPMMAGMMGPGMGARGPVPPPKPPPPRSPPPERQLLEPKLPRYSGSGRSPRSSSRSREEDIILRAFEMARRRSPSRRDRSHYRSRSRSVSPRRGRSYRRSRSRSRSRGRARNRDDLLDLDYDSYLEAYQALKRAKVKDSGMSERRLSQPVPIREHQLVSVGSAMAPAMVGPQSGNGMLGASPMMASVGGGGRANASNLSEDDYVKIWENYSKMTGRPFDAQAIRGCYRQYKQFGAANK